MSYEFEYLGEPSPNMTREALLAVERCRDLCLVVTRWSAVGQTAFETAEMLEQMGEEHITAITALCEVSMNQMSAQLMAFASVIVSMLQEELHGSNKWISVHSVESAVHERFNMLLDALPLHSMIEDIDPTDFGG